MRQSLTNRLFFYAPDAEATEALGGAFALHATAPLTLWLAGDLGSGKTTFSCSFIRALGYAGRVTSPTYTLLEVYEVDAFRVLHFDFYRLDTMQDLEGQDFEATGARDYLDERSICLIEWPDNVAAGKPPADLRLDFDFAGQGRRIRAAACSHAGVALLSAIRAAPGGQS